LFAWGASRYLVEARRTGELELLLTTPSGARGLVSGQLESLRRLLRWPMVVMVAPAVLQAVLVFVRAGGATFGQPDPYGLVYAISSVLGCLNLLLEVGALCWVGTWFGLEPGGQARAIVWTVSLVKGVPVLAWSLRFFVMNVIGRGVGRWGIVGYGITLWLPEVGSLLFYAGLICLARGRLLRDLAAGEPVRLDLRQSLIAATRDALVTVRKARHWTPS